jgi:hypothetical protein
VRDLGLGSRAAIGALLVDHVYAFGSLRFAKRERDLDRRDYILGLGLPMWLVWTGATAIGAFAGAQVPPTWQLDFAVPLMFLALLIPSIRDRPGLVAALTGGGLALALAGCRTTSAWSAPRSPASRPARPPTHSSRHAARGRVTRPEVWLTIAGMALVTFACAARSCWRRTARRCGRWCSARCATCHRPSSRRSSRPPSRRASGAALGPFDLRLIAGLVAGLVAWRTRSILATFGTGMLTLWGLTWLLG